MSRCCFTSDESVSPAVSADLPSPIRPQIFIRPPTPTTEQIIQENESAKRLISNLKKHEQILTKADRLFERSRKRIRILREENEAMKKEVDQLNRLSEVVKKYTEAEKNEDGHPEELKRSLIEMYQERFSKNATRNA